MSSDTSQDHPSAPPPRDPTVTICLSKPAIVATSKWCKANAIAAFGAAETGFHLDRFL
jgi:hypothetical protein